MITLLVEPWRFDLGDVAPGGEPASKDSASEAHGGERGATPGRPELLVVGDAYRHLFRARRLAVGDRLRVVDGAGRARWGQVVRVARSAGMVALGEHAAANEPRMHLELLVPTLRPERAAWLVEKATELGAAAVRFLNTERAPRSFGGGTAGRLLRVAAAAVEQCHRSRCPEITGPHPFAELVHSEALVHPATLRWLLDPAAPSLGFQRRVAPPAPLSSGASSAAGQPPEYLLVGPEGGWAPAEVQVLEAAGWQRVGLGSRVLRVETAAIAGAVLLLLKDAE